MPAVAIRIESGDLDKVIASAKELEAELTSNDLLLVAGRSIQQTTKEHFELLSRDTQHHRSSQALGAEPTGFYEEATQAVQQPVVEGSDSVSISINGPEGLAQRFFGGTIQGKPYLTIPAIAETYGRRAREFDDLQLIIFPSGAGALVRKGEKFIPHESDIYYWLVKSVTQAADPSVLPTDEELLDPALQVVQEQIAAVWERKAA